MTKTLAILVCFVLGGCALFQSPAPTVISDYCDFTKIIRPSRSDTAGTLRQVGEHNAVRRDLCPEKPAAK